MTIEISTADAGKNIRELLRRDMGYSSGMLKKLKFKENGITVNGSFVTVRYVLREGDVLVLKSEDTEADVSPYIVPVDIDIPVIFEDEHLTVVNKPPHIAAHPSLGHRDDTVANALAYRYSGKPYVFRPVNRLDCDTSGLMITANTKLAASKMYRVMTGGGIHKAYIAVLDGELETGSGVIRTFIRRCADSIVKHEICDEGEGGREAVTEYTVAARGHGHTVLIGCPVTGRTHQLRVHFATLDTPITGDTMYGSASGMIPRQALHAAWLKIPHPSDGRILTLHAPLPDDMSELISAIFGQESEEIIGKCGEICSERFTEE